jgi:hypothetical protein
VFVLLLTDRSRAAAVNASCLGLLVAAIIYQGGFQLIIVMALATLLTILALEGFALIRIDGERVIVCALLGALLALAITAPKLYAVFALMRFFPRETADIYTTGLLQAFAGLGAQFALVMPAAPLMWISGIDLMGLTGAMMRLIGAGERMGLWEFDTGISPVLIVCLVAGVVWLIRNRAAVKLDSRQRYALIATIAAAWLAMEMTLARGLVYPLIQQLPVMRSLHVNVRFAAVFILPLCTIGALALDRLRPRSALVWTALALSTVSPAAYLLLPAQSHQRTFDVAQSIDVYRRIAAGDRFPVTAIADVGDAEALATGASSLRVYEPLFGYANEVFLPQLTVGSTSLIRDGRYNITNPSGLVFPELNELNVFSRVLADDSANFHAFVERRQPAWRVPPIHAQLVMLSLAATVLALAGALLRLRSPRAAQ